MDEILNFAWFSHRQVLKGVCFINPSQKIVFHAKQKSDYFFYTERSVVFLLVEGPGWLNELGNWIT